MHSESPRCHYGGPFGLEMKDNGEGTEIGMEPFTLSSHENIPQSAN